MNIKEIREMLQLMAEHDLAELEIDKDGFKIKLRKNNSGKIAVEQMQIPTHQFLPQMSSQQTHSAPKGGSSQDSLADNNITLIKSPMVGTFYTAPAPDQPAYAVAGTKISEGDTLCIVEAMKLMNEIKSEYSGEVVEVLVKNGQPIEFDQPLFKIKKI